MNAPAATDLSDLDLLCQFESLGRNCEFGFVQRLAGAEPMGLLRFAGMPFDSLLQALNTRFAGITEPGNFKVSLEDGEYRITAPSLGFGYHTQLHEGEIGLELVHRIEQRKTRFLVSQLVEDLEKQRKIFIYHRQNAMPDQDVRLLLQALAGYGHATLLWVIEPRPGHPAGTVRRIGDNLMVGHVARLAPGESVHRPHLPSWLAVCREAHRLWRPGRAVPTKAAGPNNTLTEIGFGAAGAAGDYQVSGWSQPEADFTWTFGTESRLKLPRAGNLDLMLGLQLFPFTDPTHVPAQGLTVLVNGAEVAAFTVKNPSYLQCPIPTGILRREDDVRVTFRHPDATRPSTVLPGNTDDRPLAFAFQRISLSWT